jgi:lipid-A-disaccharide synthase-like uncharacterized protein
MIPERPQESLTDRDGTSPPAAAAEKLPPPVKNGIPRSARRILLVAAALLLPAAILAATRTGWTGALGVLGGGAVALGNFWLLARIVVRVTAGPDLELRALMARLLFKFGLLGASLFAVVLLLRMDPLGVLLGVSVVFVALVLVSIVDWLL